MTPDINKEFRVAVLEMKDGAMQYSEVYDLSETQVTEYFKLFFKRLRNGEVQGITLENSPAAERAN